MVVGANELPRDPRKPENPTEQNKEPRSKNLKIAWSEKPEVRVQKTKTRKTSDGLLRDGLGEARRRQKRSGRPAATEKHAHGTRGLSHARETDGSEDGGRATQGTANVLLPAAVASCQRARPAVAAAAAAAVRARFPDVASWHARDTRPSAPRGRASRTQVRRTLMMGTIFKHDLFQLRI